MLKAASHLLELINEVLDIARIESGRLSISPEPVALADTVRDVLDARRAAGERSPDQRSTRTSTGLADDGHVYADRNRLKQVLLNLLSNAVKYNRAGGRVDVSFQITDTGRVRTLIADTGIGIEPDQLQKLFEPFERLGAEATEVEGTGLGLTLSKGLIEAMGGTIEVGPRLGQRNHIHDRAGLRPERHPTTPRRPTGSRPDRVRRHRGPATAGSSTSKTTSPTSPSSSESWIDSPASK